MNLIVDIVISLAILCIIAGAWLSMPSSVPFAPSQRFIDSLPTWLQGPRRIAPKVKEEAWSILDEIHERQVANAFDAVIEHRAMPTTPPQGGSVIAEQPGEAEPAEAIHDEP